MKNSGFTLIEILVTIGIVAIIATFSVPMTIDFYNGQVTKSTTDEIFSALKKAQAYSLYRRNDSIHGISFDEGENEYVLFSIDIGDYSGPDSDDDVYDLNGVAVSFSGVTEPEESVYFEKGTGMPREVVTITLTKGLVTQDISVCESGLIELGDDCGDIEEP